MAADSVAGAYNIYGPNIPGVGDCSAGCAVGGTSEASPLAMGAYARLVSAHGGALGYAAPLLYQNYVANQNGATTVTGPPPTQALGGFHDVIGGAQRRLHRAPRLRLHDRPGHARRQRDERADRALIPTLRAAAGAPLVRTMREAPVVETGASCVVRWGWAQGRRARLREPRRMALNIKVANNGPY